MQTCLYLVVRWELNIGHLIFYMIIECFVPDQVPTRIVFRDSLLAVCESSLCNFGVQCEIKVFAVLVLEGRREGLQKFKDKVALGLFVVLVSWDFSYSLICLLKKLSHLVFEVCVKFLDDVENLAFLAVLEELISLLDVAEVEAPREEAIHVQVLVSILYRLREV